MQQLSYDLSKKAISSQSEDDKSTELKKRKNPFKGEESEQTE
jgi:hypothetical protein